MRDNYFSVDGQFFFFQSSNYRDIEAAFHKAELVGGKVAVFKVPMHSGAWDRCGIVGHRLRGEILADMGGPNTDVELEMLKYELAAHDRAYYSAGRDALPTQAVAA